MKVSSYINTEQEFLSWTGHPGNEPRSWLLLDREVADRLCPAAAGHREYWQSGMAREAEAAAHTDNLIPVARASRSASRRDARLLRDYASALRDADSRAQAPERSRILGRTRTSGPPTWHRSPLPRPIWPAWTLTTPQTGPADRSRAARMHGFRRLAALFWLILLRPGGPASTGNAPGTLRRQADRLLTLPN